MRVVKRAIGIGLGLFLLASATGACRDARSASCTADGDCPTDAPKCVYGGCYVCRSDDDCKSPAICGQKHTCETLEVGTSPPARM